MTTLPLVEAQSRQRSRLAQHYTPRLLVRAVYQSVATMAAAKSFYRNVFLQTSPFFKEVNVYLL
jgi:hypothetical protein